MSEPSYHRIVSQCVAILRHMEAWLDQAEQHASAKKFDVGVLMASRLAPDMQTFVYQVQSACDYVKSSAGYLSGQTPPRHEDNERTIDEVRARLKKTIAFAEGVDPAGYADAAQRTLSLPWAPGKVMCCEDYLIQITIPNVFFHATMAYAILRHNGVDIGKMDFLGSLAFVDA